MLNVYAALTAAGVPSYRAAFRPAEGQETPPATYCVYTQTRTPIWEQDDGYTAMRCRAFLHLLGHGDPEETQAAVRQAMAAQGWQLISESDTQYENGAEMYEILSEWGGIDQHGR